MEQMVFTTNFCFFLVYMFFVYDIKNRNKKSPYLSHNISLRERQLPASAWKNNMAALSVEKGPLFKVILLGEAGVGKTSIFYRAKENSFLQHRKNTVGIDSFSMYIKVGDQQVTVSEVSV